VLDLALASASAFWPTASPQKKDRQAFLRLAGLVGG
jgi:hypothetical protein